MKNSVLILGVVLVSFSTISNAKNTVNLPYRSFKNITLSDDFLTETNGTAKFGKPSLANNAEVFNPETVIAYNPKTIKEIIIEGNKIVEATDSDEIEFLEYEESMRELIAQSDLVIESTVSDTIYPLHIERTISDEIAELELIIESSAADEVKPLDFKKINGDSIMINSISTKKFIGMN
ncbi:hypothetical protein [Flavobacterium marginilacus]|uniref:hypothetical protein n=1 Tax=Flavobacterium marginilacus TaxID=3003256 RepID=UPI00248DEE38|nr:hypothetical protein [Flavobacterium marginilacus]